MVLIRDLNFHLLFKVQHFIAFILTTPLYKSQTTEKLLTTILDFLTLPKAVYRWGLKSGKLIYIGMVMFYDSLLGPTYSSYNTNI